MRRYAEALNYIFNLNAKRRIFLKFGFERMEKVLSALGNPHQMLKIVHVAGTKGKGSVISFLSFILREKYKTGLFTSPSLVNVNERISIDGCLMPPVDFLQYVNILKNLYEKINNELVPTTFETFAIMAFKYFADRKTDISLFEVGMGGRLDATNIIDSPLISVITPISFDHQKFLGNTLGKIAAEKAGIIKSGVPVVVAKQKKSAEQCILSVAKKKNAPAILYGEDFRVECFKENQNGISFDFYSSFSGTKIEGLELHLLGKHQAENAAVAVQSAILLNGNGFDITEADIRNGLKAAFWPGRLEIVSRNPTVVLDGAHNGASARALNNALNLMSKKKKIFVFGILKDKNIDDVLKVLAKNRDALFVFTEVPFSGKRRLPANILVAFAKKYIPPKNIFYFENFEKAFYFSKNLAEKDDIVCVTGSLYLVAAVRRMTNHFVFSSNIL